MYRIHWKRQNVKSLRGRRDHGISSFRRYSVCHTSLGIGDPRNRPSQFLRYLEPFFISPLYTLDFCVLSTKRPPHENCSLHLSVKASTVMIEFVLTSIGCGNQYRSTPRWARKLTRDLKIMLTGIPRTLYLVRFQP